MKLLTLILGISSLSILKHDLPKEIRLNHHDIVKFRKDIRKRGFIGQEFEVDEKLNVIPKELKLKSKQN